MLIIRVNNEACSGCRACEIACSYHHVRKYGRRSSSVLVTRFIDTGKKEILILEREQSSHPPCDECGNEAVPLCVKYCSSGALKEGD